MSLTARAAGNTMEITPTNTSGNMTITLVIKGNPAATDFDVALPTSLAYDGTAKTASATAKSTVPEWVQLQLSIIRTAQRWTALLKSGIIR